MTAMTLDHLSGGRAGWNVVTSFDAFTGANFRRGGFLDRADRYARAEEAVRAVTTLWDTWTSDAVRADAPSGEFLADSNGYYTDEGWRFEPGVGSAEYAAMALRWREEGAQIIGGCCGVGPAHVAAARTLGAPARYVSGYCLSGFGGANRPTPHGWAEAWIDGLGWVSFDPCFATSADESYVRVAIGLDAAGAAPVAGYRMGDGDEELRAEVSVETVDE